MTAPPFGLLRRARDPLDSHSGAHRQRVDAARQGDGMSAPAQVRRDAALIARIYRRCVDDGDRWTRNARARIAARRFVEAWLFQNKEVSRA